MSAAGRTAENICSQRVFRLLTQLRHERAQFVRRTAHSLANDVLECGLQPGMGCNGASLSPLWAARQRRGRFVRGQRMRTKYTASHWCRRLHQSQRCPKVEITSTTFHCYESWKA